MNDQNQNSNDAAKNSSGVTVESPRPALECGLCPTCDATTKAARAAQDVLCDVTESRAYERFSEIAKSRIQSVIFQLRRSLEGEHPRVDHEQLSVALDESVKLQSHYAVLLNQHDGGERLPFENALAWIARLRDVGKLPLNVPERETETQQVG